MRGRKFLAMVLCFALGMGVAAPALAAGEVDDAALKAVTQKVKATLGLDTEIYTDFEGTAQEDALMGRRWDLNWWGDGVSLSIQADDNGKIYYYNRNDLYEEPVADNAYYRGSGFSIPSLPKADPKEAAQVAQNFLNAVLDGPVETALVEEDESIAALWQGSASFSANLSLYGIPSPIRCNVQVRSGDNEVTYFYRSDRYRAFVGTLPNADTNVTEVQARRHLRSTFHMEPFFMLEEDGVTARVVYQPVFGDDYYVDGKTGELVNLTELRQALSTDRKNMLFGGNMAPEAAMDAAEGALTKVEVEGAAKLAGALSKEDLDRAIQSAWPEFGLDRYTLDGASYSVQEISEKDALVKEYDVTARLTYKQQLTDGAAWKYVTVNAKTGEVQDLYGWRPVQETVLPSVRRQTALATANRVLSTFAGEPYAQLALYEPQSTQEATLRDATQFSFTFAQTAYGFFYLGNQYTVAVDGVDGSISCLSGGFDTSVVLQDPGPEAHHTTEAQARDTYLAALKVDYHYLEVPAGVKSLDRDLQNRLKDLYDYVTTLRPGFELVSDWSVRGVYLDDGTLSKQDWSPADENAITYDDVAGTWVQEAAETLAKYGIGFAGGSLKAAEALTQLDMISLLCSVEQHDAVPLAREDQQMVDDLYQRAYRMGLLSPQERAEDKVITRGTLVRVILKANGYERLAALPGIFRCDFSDAAEISEADMGYAAIAQGLGLVRGGSDGAFAGGRDITRGEAVAMLYQYMK